MDRARSKNVLVYYDVGNSTKAGFDVVKEIRWLGKARICQIHLKDNPNYMGEGTINFTEVVKAIRDIGFAGYCNLETDTKPGSTVEADMRKNLAFIRATIERGLGRHANYRRTPICCRHSCPQPPYSGHLVHCRTSNSGLPSACIRIA